MTLKSGDKSYYGLDKIRTDDRMREKWPSLPPYISPLPFYPTLRRALRSHGAAVLLVYLEVFHWIDMNVVLAHVQQELQITKRSWWWIANAIAVRHPNQKHLRAAQMAHREFVKDLKGIHGLIMPYSLTGTDAGPRNCILSRNETVLWNLLASAGLTARQIRADAAKLRPRPRPDSSVKSTHQPLAPFSAPNAVDHANKLSDIIERSLTTRHAKLPDAHNKLKKS